MFLRRLGYRRRYPTQDASKSLKSITMPRPKTKTELLSVSADRYLQLNAMLRGLTQSQRTADFPFDHRDRNVRDVVAHLLEWQLMMLRCYEIGMGGAKPDMPAEGYTWKTTPELNAVIWAKYQQTSLDSACKKLGNSHVALLDIIDTHTDHQLFTKRFYSWTGTTSLGAYFTSALSSHYDWALTLIRSFTRATTQNVG
jgi:hypothetical protein